MGLDGEKAAQAAYNLIGSQNYQYSSPHPESRGLITSALNGRKSNKCNAFVWDVLVAGGNPPGRMPDGRIPSASEWPDPNVSIPNYKTIDPGSGLKPGDVVAASGHVGVYYPLPSGGGEGNLGTISASGIEQRIVHNTWGFRNGGVPSKVQIADFLYSEAGVF